MATIFLIRHGLTAQTGKVLYGRTPGIPLDHRGKAQADELVRRMAPVRLTAVYSSPLERCLQTVEPLASANHLTVIPSEALIEMDAGSWTGKSLGRLRGTRAWRTVQRAPSAFSFPGGEGFVEAQARAVAEVTRIARRHRRGRVAISTHGDIARILVAHFAGVPLDGFQRLVIDTAAISVIQVEADRAHVLLVNDTGGLDRFGKDPPPPWEGPGGDGSRRQVRG